MRIWDDGQREYELFHEGESAQDSIESYLAEIDSVKEIYTQEFHLHGSVLDVGGHQGRLRYYLSPQDVPLYISIDPFLQVFENIQLQSNLLSAYACLSEPCNFIAARAEELPFVGNSFDWVHMRSVVDHLEDPFKAFKEAYRVLKPNGNLMIGLAIMEMITQLAAKAPPQTGDKLKQKIKGMIRLALAVLGKFSKTEIAEDHHIFRLTHAELHDLLSVTGFEINKEHWQKPPFNYVIYLGASANKNNQAEAAPQL
jgi:SAM-dependent methyltransferase